MNSNHPEGQPQEEPIGSLNWMVPLAIKPTEKKAKHAETLDLSLSLNLFPASSNNSSPAFSKVNHVAPLDLNESDTEEGKSPMEDIAVAPSADTNNHRRHPEAHGRRSRSSIPHIKHEPSISHSGRALFSDIIDKSSRGRRSRSPIAHRRKEEATSVSGGKSRSRSPSDRRHHGRGGGGGRDQKDFIVMVANVHYCTTDKEFHELFEKEPTHRINIPRDWNTGNGRGYAFVTYYSHADAIAALKKFAGYELHGRPIRLEWSTHDARASRPSCYNCNGTGHYAHECIQMPRKKDKKTRSRSRSRDKYRERERESDRSKDREKDKYKERSKEKDKAKSKFKDGERSKEKHRGRSRDRNAEKFGESEGKAANSTPTTKERSQETEKKEKENHKPLDGTLKDTMADEIKLSTVEQMQPVVPLPATTATAKATATDIYASMLSPMSTFNLEQMFKFMMPNMTISNLAMGIPNLATPFPPSPSAANLPPPIWYGEIARGGIKLFEANGYWTGANFPSNLIPKILNVTKRTDLQQLVQVVSKTIPVGRLYLLPSAEADYKPYVDFITYLNERNRAGIVEGRTTLYIMPPSANTLPITSVDKNILCVLVIAT